MGGAHDPDAVGVVADKSDLIGFHGFLEIFCDTASRDGRKIEGSNLVGPNAGFEIGWPPREAAVLNDRHLEVQVYRPGPGNFLSLQDRRSGGRGPGNVEFQFLCHAEVWKGERVCGVDSDELKRHVRYWRRGSALATPHECGANARDNDQGCDDEELAQMAPHPPQRSKTTARCGALRLADSHGLSSDIF